MIQAKFLPCAFPRDPAGWSVGRRELRSGQRRPSDAPSLQHLVSARQRSVSPLRYRSVIELGPGGRGADAHARLTVRFELAEDALRLGVVEQIKLPKLLFTTRVRESENSVSAWRLFERRIHSRAKEARCAWDGECRHHEAVLVLQIGAMAVTHL